MAVAGGVGVGIAAEANYCQYAVLEIVVMHKPPKGNGEGIDDIAAEIFEFGGVFIEGAADECVDVFEPELVIFFTEIHPSGAVGGDVFFVETVKGAV